MMNHNSYIYIAILLFLGLQFTSQSVKGAVAPQERLLIMVDSVAPIDVIHQRCDRIAVQLQRSKERIAELNAVIRSKDLIAGPVPAPSPAPRPEPSIIPEPGSVPVSEFARLQVVLNNALATLSDVRSDNSNLRTQLDLAQNELNQLQQQNANLREKIVQLNELIESLRQTIQEQETEIAELKQTIQEQAAEIERLKAEIVALKADYMYMINRFNENSTQLYVSYDFPRTSKNDYYYIVAGKSQLPRDQDIKASKIRTFYVNIKLFIPEEVPIYKVDLIITNDDGLTIPIEVELNRNTAANGSHLGFFLYEGSKEFTRGLPDKRTLGTLFKKRERFFEKDKPYTYEIKLDLPDSTLSFPRGKFYLD